MRALLIAALLLAGCANVNATGTASRVSNPSCVVFCFDRRVPGDLEPVAVPTNR